LQPQNFSLQRSLVPLRIGVDLRAIANAFSTLGKLQCGERLMTASNARGHIGHEHGLGVAAEGVLQKERELGVTVRDVATGVLGLLCLHNLRNR
jgi:hypothetical protein